MLLTIATPEAALEQLKMTAITAGGTFALFGALIVVLVVYRRRAWGLPPLPGPSFPSFRRQAAPATALDPTHQEKVAQLAQEVAAIRSAGDANDREDLEKFRQRCEQTAIEMNKYV